MSLRLIQYKPSAFRDPEHQKLPGMPEFSYFGKFFTLGLAPTDRTRSIRLPVSTACLFPIPPLRPQKKTFEELCDDRAIELLKLAEQQDADLYSMWSGGIDSTLVLVSLLKHATVEQKKRIVVLMTGASITENPRFYEQHVHGKLRRESATRFPLLLGGPAIITTGEQNDQLFGFDAIGRLMERFGADIVHKPRKRETFFEFFNEPAGNPAITNLYLDLFERLMANAPVEIRTHFHYLWWINFSLKWQNAFMRMLASTPARNVEKITNAYISGKYASFYGTEDFQLWSLNNTDQRIKDEWRTYKWVCKDIIYKFTKDADYRRNKTKQGSLRHVMVRQNTFNFIAENFKFYRTLDPAEYYVRENDFTFSAQ